MNRSRKLLLSTLVVGATGAVAGLGVFAAFTATTENTGNQITAGTVQLTDNDGDAALYVRNGVGPGNVTQRCIRVTYGGTLPSSVRLYMKDDSLPVNGSAFEIQVERGVNAVPGDQNCGSFTPSSVAFPTDTLDNFPTTWDDGVTGKNAGAAWMLNDSIDYRFTVTVRDDSTPNAHETPITSGAHGFQWEARNN